MVDILSYLWPRRPAFFYQWFLSWILSWLCRHLLLELGLHNHQEEQQQDHQLVPPHAILECRRKGWRTNVVTPILRYMRVGFGRPQFMTGLKIQHRRWPGRIYSQNTSLRDFYIGKIYCQKGSVLDLYVVQIAAYWTGTDF